MRVLVAPHPCWLSVLPIFFYLYHSGLVLSHFDFNFPDGKKKLSMVSYIYWPLHTLLCEFLVQAFWPFLCWLFVSLIYLKEHVFGMHVLCELCVVLVSQTWWLKITEVYCLIDVEARVCNQRVSRPVVRLEALGGVSFLPSSRFRQLEAFRGLRLRDSDLYLHLHVNLHVAFLPVLLCLYSHSLFSYTNTGHWIQNGALDHGS